MGIAKPKRIKKQQDFKVVFDKHQIKANKMFVVYHINLNSEHYRIGISVGKKVGKAHDRVWVKRRIRQAIQQLHPFLKNEEIVIVAKPIAAKQSFTVIYQQLIHVLKLSGLLQKEFEESSK